MYLFIYFSLVSIRDNRIRCEHQLLRNPYRNQLFSQKPKMIHMKTILMNTSIVSQNVSYKPKATKLARNNYDMIIQVNRPFEKRNIQCSSGQMQCVCTLQWPTKSNGAILEIWSFFNQTTTNINKNLCAFSHFLNKMHHYLISHVWFLQAWPLETFSTYYIFK